MNKLFLSLAFLFSVLVSEAQTRIYFDYTKSFEVSSLWVDYNQNDEPELDEFYKVTSNMRCTITLEYDDSGQNIKFMMPVVNKDSGQSKTFKADLDNVMLFKTSSGYFVCTKYKDKLFGLARDEDGTYAVLVFNPMILK